MFSSDVLTLSLPSEDFQSCTTVPEGPLATGGYLHLNKLQLWAYLVAQW